MFEQMITSSTGKFCSHFLVPDSLPCIGEFSTQIAANKVLLAVRGQPLLAPADHWGWEVHLGATLRRRNYSGCCTTLPAVGNSAWQPAWLWCQKRVDEPTSGGLFPWESLYVLHHSGHVPFVDTHHCILAQQSLYTHNAEVWLLKGLSGWCLLISLRSEAISSVSWITAVMDTNENTCLKGSQCLTRQRFWNGRPHCCMVQQLPGAKQTFWSWMLTHDWDSQQCGILHFWKHHQQNRQHQCYKLIGSRIDTTVKQQVKAGVQHPTPCNQPAAACVYADTPWTAICCAHHLDHCIPTPLVIRGDPEVLWSHPALIVWR